MSVVNRDYKIDGLGQADRWSMAADIAAEQIERWVKENCERLRPVTPPGEREK